MKDGSAFLNDNAQRIIDGMIGNAERLRIAVSRGPLGECLIDAGAKAAGGVEAGLRMAEAAMGGLGSISVGMDRASQKWPFTVEVRSSQPVLACLGSQYAGWNLSSQDYFAMGSGPARALARVEPLFEALSYRDTASSAVLILETAEPPPRAIVEKVGKATGLATEKLTFLYAPT
ncbi:MAG: methenyltetrahydromethanopterin cyclohydrolase, partial [Mesorhizobium sp.]